MQQQQDGRFINVEQRCLGDAGTEQRGCQRAAPPWLGWGPPRCPLTVPVQGCGCQSLRSDPGASTELCRHRVPGRPSPGARHVGRSRHGAEPSGHSSKISSRPD